MQNGSNCGKRSLWPHEKSTYNHDMHPEIKARREKNGRGSGFSILSVIRDLETKNFHYLIAVQFHKDFSVYRAYKISYKTVVKHATWIESVHGWRVVLNNKLLEDRGVTEITEKLK